MKSSRIGALQLEIHLVPFVPIRDVHPPHMMLNHILTIANSEPGHNINILMLTMKTNL